MIFEFLMMTTLIVLYIFYLLLNSKKAKKNVITDYKIICKSEKTPFVSKSEEECRKIFEEFFNPHKFPSLYHPDIVNPLTKRCLQLDGYNDKLELAFEFNGSQHYEFVPRFHKSNKDLESQKMRDNIKKKRCEELGIKLIIIPYFENNKRQFIQNKLKELKLI